MVVAPQVLLVAFHYPPEISGGVPRALAFESQLTAAGCRVRVLTPQPADAARHGGDLLHVPLPGLLAPAATSAPNAPQARSSPLRTFARRWVFVPDGFVLWARRALRRALESASEHPIDLVVTSSPPESTHAIGRALQSKLGCAWLADLRDGWTFEPHRPEASLPLRSVIERRMERAVVGAADWVTAATAPLADDLTEKYPEWAQRIHLLPTGFDRAALAAARGEPTAPPRDVFRLVYTGRMGLSRDTGAPAVFFAALRSVLTTDAEFADRFQLTLVGQYSDDERALWSEAPLASHVEELGPRPYEDALRISAGATMLLLLTPHGQRSVATRKIFDYLAVARPVFALAEDNEAARILGVTRAGLCVPSHDVEAVAAQLRRAFGLWRDGQLDRAVPCDQSDRFESGPMFGRLLRDHVLPRLR